MDGPFSRPTCRVVFRTLLAAHAGRGGGQVRPHGGARRRPCPGECSMTARRWGAGMIVACVPVPRSAIPGNDYLGIILPIPDPAVRVPVRRCRCLPRTRPIASWPSHRHRVAGRRCAVQGGHAHGAEWPRHRGTGPRGRARRSPRGSDRRVPGARCRWGGADDPGNAATGVGRSVSRFISIS